MHRAIGADTLEALAYRSAMLDPCNTDDQGLDTNVYEHGTVFLLFNLLFRRSAVHFACRHRESQTSTLVISFAVQIVYTEGLGRFVNCCVRIFPSPMRSRPWARDDLYYSWM